MPSKPVDRKAKEGRTPMRNANLVWDIAVPYTAGVALCGAAVYAIHDHPLVANLSYDNEPIMRGEYGTVLPLAAVAGYIAMVHVGNPLYKKVTGTAEGPSLAFPLFLWNIFLWLLSVMMLIGLAVPMWAQATAVNFDVYAVMCDPKQERWSGLAYASVYLFALSKFAELIDTVFLIVRKKPVLVLHHYHHWTVLLYTWFAVSTRFSSGFFFAAVNAGVHSVMYYYYALRARGVNPPGAKYIIQISQMVLGLLILCVHAYFHFVEVRPCPADAPVPMLVGGAVMYGSYLVLFVKFFMNRYSGTKVHKKQQ